MSDVIVDDEPYDVGAKSLMKAKDEMYRTRGRQNQTE